jgi:hypothetical protein
MKARKLYLSILVVILISGCGGGGGGEENPTPTSLDLNTGVLIDSAVEGVSYHTETQAGTTNSKGEFSYKNGEIITFSIGALDFPQVTAIQMITPLTLAGAVSLTDQTATNIARLLQSLDEDGDPQNGIKILSNAALVATQMDFDVDASTFETNPNVINLVANSGSVNTSLVSAAEAQVHLGGTLNDVGIDTDTTTTGVGRGTIRFSGPGAAVLPTNAFIPTECRSIGLGPTGAELLTWADEKMTIKVVTISNNVISQISIKTKNTNPIYQWGILLLTDPINSTYDGSMVAFAGDTLSELNLLAGDITINGSLTNCDTIVPSPQAELVITSVPITFSQDFTQACIDEFGANAKVAGWNELVGAYNSKTELDSFLSDTGFSSKFQAFVSYNGNISTTSYDAFVAIFANQQLPPSFFIESIDNGMFGIVGDNLEGDDPETTGQFLLCRT